MIYLPQQTEVAWAAGFFDGEGSTLIFVQSGRPHLRLNVVQIEEEPLERFRRAVSGGTLKGPYWHRNPRNKPFWRWRVDRVEEVTRILDLLLPFCCSTKRNQAEAAIEAYRSLRPMLAWKVPA